MHLTHYAKQTLIIGSLLLFTACGGGGGGSTETNTAPTVIDINITTNEDTPKSFTLSGSDADGDTLTYTITQDPSHGTISGDTYTPVANYHGTDSFTFKACDTSDACSAEATVNITITPVNDNPTIQSIADITKDEDFTDDLKIDIDASDIDGDTLSYSVSTTNSSLINTSISGDTLTITPQPNANGTTTITVTVDDGNGGSASTSFSVTINPVNDNPTIQSIADITKDEDFTDDLKIDIDASDIDGDTLSYSVSTTSGSLINTSISGDTLTITPQPNANGTTTVTVTVDDGNGGSASTSFSVTINPVNDNPTIQSIADITKDEDFTDDLKIDIDASDIDEDTLSYSVSTTSGSLINTSISGDTLTITPQPNANGTTTVTVTVDDGNGGSASTSFSVTLTPVNDAPIIQAEITIAEDTEIANIRDYISDPENDSFTDKVTAYPAHGYIYYSTYHPAQNYYGTDSYTIQACDSSNACSTQEVTITITPVNDAPFAYSSHYKSPDYQSIAVDLNATDIDNASNELTYKITINPMHGTYDPDTKTYTPDSNYTGVDYFSYTATDPDGLSSTGRVYITVGDIPAPYITIWDTSITHYEDPNYSSWSYDSNTTSTQLKIGANPYETYNFTIDWGDGHIDSNVTQTITHDYSTEGNYTVIISGDYPHSWMGDWSTDENYKHYDAMKLRSIEQWGDQQWSTMGYAYLQAHTMQMHAADRPDLSNVTSMSYMFSGATSFNQPLESWDVSGVTNMSSMFYGATSFNQPLESWDVSGVTSMYYMFYGATSFNQPLESWDVSGVTSMGLMFYGAASFNQPLESWDVSGVTSMGLMFYDAASFNQPLESWDVSGVTSMSSMFSGATSFNQPLESWDVSSVISMYAMFREATSFNQPLESWDVSGVTSMYAMFLGATSFNQPLNNWDVSNVTSMSWMFYGAASFNQDISSWDVSSVTSMEYMFYGATSFNQDISSWDVTAVEKTGDYDWQKGMYGMLDDTALSTANYDKLLNAWSQQTLHSDITLGAAGLTYSSDAQTARDTLINDFNWTIEGDAQE